jgi:hypothetical protein
VKTGVVIGFPLVASVTTAKRLEAEECLRLGADEFDMVMDPGALRDRWPYVAGRPRLASTYSSCGAQQRAVDAPGCGLPFRAEGACSAPRLEQPLITAMLQQLYPAL